MNFFHFNFKNNKISKNENLNKYVFSLQKPNKTILKGIIRGQNLRSLSVDNGLEITHITVPLFYIDNIKNNNKLYIKYDSKYFTNISFDKVDNFLNILLFLLIKIYMVKKLPARGIVFNKKKYGFALGFLGLIIKLPFNSVTTKKLPCNRLWDVASFLYVNCTLKVYFSECKIHYLNKAKKFNFEAKVNLLK